MRKGFKRSAAAAAVAAGVMLSASAAMATQTTVTGSLTRDQQTFYTTQRTITSGGSNIYFQKTDGPAIDLKWYKCSDASVSGAWVAFANADPTARQALGTNFQANTVFCLAAWDHGTNATDQFTGQLWYNVFS